MIMTTSIRSEDVFQTLIAPSWSEALSGVEKEIESVWAMLQEEQALGRRPLPRRDDIFRAFSYPFDQVKVLLVGQDPYPTPGHAMGLSFSVPPDVAPPASLRNIYKELTDDLGVPSPETGDLRPWAEQGVCLLNRVLTVEAGKPNSHRGRGWEKITEAAIEGLVGRRKPLVAILWGKEAQSLAPLLDDTPIITSPHPSPLAAYRGFFGSKPFSRTNELLRNQGASAIDWQL